MPEKKHIILRIKTHIKKAALCTAIVIAAIMLILGALVFARLMKFRSKAYPEPLAGGEREALFELLDDKYPDERTLWVKPLPYTTVPAALNVSAASAILIDMATGSVLFEKKADREIPPASMTKLAVMYVVMQDIQSGRIKYDDVVPLPPECWACNMMPHSSLMFLGEGQVVTVEELLTGLDVCSGNDAAYALAFYTSGSMAAFIRRMNAAVGALGLRHTHFVEASGYDSRNVTTAREMASFARAYLTAFPDVLERFHSQQSFTYPQEHNLDPDDRGKPTSQDFSGGLPQRITMGITQRNTNTLLGVLDGCDGLKTGYIDESGYNLALTVKRDGTRFLSVTMGGPGRNVIEGNAHREADGRCMMEWAFSNFADCTRSDAVHDYMIPVTSGQDEWARLTPAYPFSALTVPHLAGDTAQDAARAVSVMVEYPRFIDGGTERGAQYGCITYTLGEHVLQTIPLVADRNIGKGSPVVCALDTATRFVLSHKDNAKKE